MKRALALLGLVGIATTAQAIPVYVTYQGTVTHVYGPSIGYQVGDAIGGQLVIETDLAPADLSADPTFGNYGYSAFTGGASFVSGFNVGDPIGLDRVGVYDGYDEEVYGYRVTDDERGYTESGQYLRGIQLLAFDTGDFINGTGIAQNFSITSANSGFYGVIYEQRSREPYSDARFDLTLLSVSTLPVPEPGTFGLLAIAAFGFFMRRRRGPAVSA